MKLEGSSGTSGAPRFAFPDGELSRAVFLGDVTDRSVRVWARLPDGPATARLEIDGQAVASAELQPDAAHDHVTAATLTARAPHPGTVFTLRLDELVRYGRFAPAENSPARFSFAFGSCHQPFGEPVDGTRLDKQPTAAIYRHIGRLLHERGAAFALWLGDQVYSDGVAEMSVRQRLAEDRSITDAALVETYRHLYRGYFNESGYRALNEAVPAYLMWDDHDIFDGWGSLLDQTDFDGRVYRAAEAAYREYQHLRNPTGAADAKPPYGFSFWYGDVGFHVPDLRSQRSFHERQVLGPAGWTQLDGFLAEAEQRTTATIFLALSVPLVHASPWLMSALERWPTGAGRDVRDRWSVPAFAADRSRLLERLFGWQSRAEGRQAIVLSGDVHVGAAFRVRARHGPGRFSQWTSSALSTPTGAKHVLANRVVTAAVRLGERELYIWPRGLATTNNVGLVEVAPRAAGGHVVRLGIHQYDRRADRLIETVSDVVGADGRG